MPACKSSGRYRRRRRGRWLVNMCADHGDVYGDDGYHGRGIAHPVVFDVPFAVWVHA